MLRRLKRSAEDMRREEETPGVEASTSARITEIDEERRRQPAGASVLATNHCRAMSHQSVIMNSDVALSPQQSPEVTVAQLFDG